MDPNLNRAPRLQTFYHQYLDDECSALFVRSVSQHYTTATLERLALYGSRINRRAAVLALGFIASYTSNAVMGQALHDNDRGVRMLAENGIREIWCRDGSDLQQQQIAVIERLNGARDFLRAEQLATALIEEAPWYAEAWNQRAIALYYLERYDDSANDCHQALEINPYHFGAAVGMAHCYLELTDAFAALDCFRRALRLNPDLEGVRSQVQYLEKSLEGQQ
ncbi:MAG: tetratricopeptide repeat protein [Planctomycetes bacterium]|nr:tetratricopeptide repeat protein [Planctomycetota bacterium]